MIEPRRQAVTYDVLVTLPGALTGREAFLVGAPGSLRSLTRKAPAWNPPAASSTT
jgi:hypothetical protein